MRTRCNTTALILAAITSFASAQWDPNNGDWGKQDPTDLRGTTWNIHDGIVSTVTRKPHDLHAAHDPAQHTRRPGGREDLRRRTRRPPRQGASRRRLRQANRPDPGRLDERARLQRPHRDVLCAGQGRPHGRA